MAVRAAGDLARRYRSSARSFALGTLTFFNRVFDRLPFGKVIEAAVGDGGMVEKNVFSAVTGDEAESFVLHELLDFA